MPEFDTKASSSTGSPPKPVWYGDRDAFIAAR
jgi:hypothetical protein